MTISRLTTAMKEAYAVNSATGDFIDTFEMDHPTFNEPVRIVTGEGDDLNLPIILGGSPVLFKRVNVDFILPGSTPEGPTHARVRLDGVSALIRAPLDGSVLGDAPITCTYRGYTTEDLTQPGDVVDGLELWDVDLDVSAATGTLKFRELELQAFPLPTYDPEFFPAIQQQ